MTYVTKSWGNDPAGGTPLNAAGLNDWESRIAAAVNVGADSLRVIYALDYGVVADGVTDDSAALNAAITAATAGIPGQTPGNAVMLPAGMMKVASQILVKNKVRLVGVGKRATVISATSGFPTNTPIVRLGSPGQPFEFDMRLENLTVDCGLSIANSSGVWSINANEGSGCFGCVITGFNKYGVWFDDGCSVVGSQDLELFSGNLGTALAGFYAFHVAGQNWLKGVTTIPTTGSGIIIQNCQWHVSDIHPEACVSGIRINDSVGCQISNVHGHSACPTIVQLDSNTGKCIVTNITANGSPATLNDDFKGVNLADDFVFYTQGDTRIGLTRMDSLSAVPSTGAHTRGEIVWNSTPSASGFIGWTCVTAGTPGTWKTFGAISA